LISSLTFFCFFFLLCAHSLRSARVHIFFAAHAILMYSVFLVCFLI
jgi:hypothetical protein